MGDRRVGFYQVDGVDYTSKYRALEACADWQWPNWNFNDKEYGALDWPVEPDDDLYQMYRDRAIQISLQYDKVVIFFSGGIDSTTVLHTFIDNDIPIDAVIVIQGQLGYMEQEVRAIPYIKKLQQAKILTCPLIELDTTSYYDFQDENWMYGNLNSLAPYVDTWPQAWKHPAMQDLLHKGKTAFVRGVDKPRIVLEEDNAWYISFLDIYAAMGDYNRTNPHQDWDRVEYFYWTPDMTSIVHKQAHMVVNWFEQNTTLEFAKKVTTKEHTFDRNVYNDYIDPIVYGKYTDQSPGDPRNYFSIGKVSEHNTLWDNDETFYLGRNNTSASRTSYNNWVKGLEIIRDSIHISKFNTPDITKTADALNKFGINELAYLSPVLAEAVGTWSKFYKIKDAEFIDKS